jgi:hypothetical protein
VHLHLGGGDNRTGATHHCDQSRGELSLRRVTPCKVGFSSQISGGTLRRLAVGRMAAVTRGRVGTGSPPGWQAAPDLTASYAPLDLPPTVAV